MRGGIWGTHKQHCGSSWFLLYQSHLLFAVSVSKRLMENSRPRAHKGETVFKEGHQPKDLLPFLHPGDTTTRRAHDVGHSDPRELYRLTNWSILPEPYLRVILYRQWWQSLDVCQPGPANTQSNPQQFLVSCAEGEYKGCRDF